MPTGQVSAGSVPDGVLVGSSPTTVTPVYVTDTTCRIPEAPSVMARAVVEVATGSVTSRSLVLPRIATSATLCMNTSSGVEVAKFRAAVNRTVSPVVYEVASVTSSMSTFLTTP